MEGRETDRRRDYTEEKSTATWAYNIFPSTLMGSSLCFSTYVSEFNQLGGVLLWTKG